MNLDTCYHVDTQPRVTSCFLLSPAEFEAVSSGTEVDLVKKVTCNGVDIQNNKQYLVMGASGSEVQQGNSFKSVSAPLLLLLTA